MDGLAVQVAGEKRHHHLQDRKWEGLTFLAQPNKNS